MQQASLNKPTYSNDDIRQHHPQEVARPTSLGEPTDMEISTRPVGQPYIHRLRTLRPATNITPPSESSTFSIKAPRSRMDSSQVTLSWNTKQLSTCESFLLDVSGGSAPYTITIVGQSYPPFNFNIPQAGQLQWVNNLDPSRSPLIVVTASDARGNFATSSGFIELNDGWESVQCPNTVPSFTPLPSSSSNQSTSAASLANTISISSSSEPTQSSDSSTFTPQSLTQVEPTTTVPPVAVSQTASITSYSTVQTAEEDSKTADLTPSRLNIIIPACAAACLLSIGMVILCIWRSRRMSSNNKKNMLLSPTMQASTLHNLSCEPFARPVPYMTQATLPQTQRRDKLRPPPQQTRVDSNVLDDLINILGLYLRTVQTPEPVERRTPQTTDHERYYRIPETTTSSIATANRADVGAAIPSGGRHDSVTLQPILSAPSPVVINRTSRTFSSRASEPLPEYDMLWAR